MTVRILDNGIAQMLRILPRSMAQICNIRPLWELLAVNGKKRRFTTESEAHRCINNFADDDAEWPLRLLFNTARGVKDDDEEELEVDFEEGYRLLVMSLGMIQNFKTVSMISIEWPPLFVEIAAFLSQFALSFDFFHPECSESVSYLYTWLFFTFMVYGMLVPFALAYWLCKTFMFKTLNETQMQLLKNTFLRTMMTVALIMLPNHFEKVLEPFVCDPSPTGRGPKRLATSHDIPCDLNDDTYR
jgi:hypothetical protein